VVDSCRVSAGRGPTGTHPFPDLCARYFFSSSHGSALALASFSALLVDELTAFVTRIPGLLSFVADLGV
jgi:hypothetical protein